MATDTAGLPGRFTPRPTSGDQERILVIAGGAIGCLFGGKLAGGHANADVAILTHWTEQEKAIRRRGVRIEEDGQVEQYYPRVVARVDDLPWEPDLALICVKSSGTYRAAREALDSGASFVVSLQNGIAQLDLLSSLLGERRVGFGVTYQAATKIGPGVIRHAGNGTTVMWGSSTTWADLLRTAALFRRGGFPASASRAGARLGWEKFAVTCGVNALAAILRIPLGALASSESARGVALMAIEEVVALARANGFELSMRKLVQHMDRTISSAAANYPSVLQDVLAGRPTEVAWLNGYVAVASGEVGLPAPTNRALALLVDATRETSSDRIRSDPLPLGAAAAESSGRGKTVTATSSGQHQR